MTSLTLGSLDTQHSAIEEQLKSLVAKVNELKANKKAIEAKDKAATKTLNKLEKALTEAKEAIEDLGEEFGELVMNKIQEFFPKSKEEDLKEEDTKLQNKENLVFFPKKKNVTNKFFTFQLTSNPQLACYVNNENGKTHAVYIGANNKGNLQKVVSNLMRLFPSTSHQLRLAERFENFKYEIKIVGAIDDNAIGYLSQFDFNKEFPRQLRTNLAYKNPLEANNIESKLKLSKKPDFVVPGIRVVNQSFPSYVCELMDIDHYYNLATVKDLDGKEFQVSTFFWFFEKKHYQELSLAHDFNQKKQTEIDLAIKQGKITKEALDLIRSIGVEEEVAS